MSPSNKRRLIVAAVLLVGAGVGTVLLWPKPPPEAVESTGGDTGMNRAQTEQMMRDIGYVQ